MSEIITQKALLELVDAWVGAGKQVVGPSLAKAGLYLYAPLRSSTQLALEGYIHPANSIKEFVFPRHEKICRYQFKGQEIELGDVAPVAAQQVIVAARPCDAATLPILDRLFNWDYEDSFYLERRQATTVVTLACAAHDDSCFCTSVRLGPAAIEGSDVLLLRREDGQYEVRTLTDKGKALFAGKTQSASERAAVPPGPDVKFDSGALRDFMRGSFENPVWRTVALRCLGCGACTYTCPTCHCFDIVDEGTAAGGSRVKNWDSCQFGMFTLHASGHNPRANQAQRQRQRLLHKFCVYPDKFGAILCTGCGNCTRNCPVSLGVAAVLTQLAKQALGAPSEVAS